jgi:hypothetical protein
MPNPFAHPDLSGLLALINWSAFFEDEEDSE